MKCATPMTSTCHMDCCIVQAPCTNRAAFTCIWQKQASRRNNRVFVDTVTVRPAQHRPVLAQKRNGLPWRLKAIGFDLGDNATKGWESNVEQLLRIAKSLLLHQQVLKSKPAQAFLNVHVPTYPLLIFPSQQCNLPHHKGFRAAGTAVVEARITRGSPVFLWRGVQGARGVWYHLIAGSFARRAGPHSIFPTPYSLVGRGPLHLSMLLMAVSMDADCPGTQQPARKGRGGGKPGRRTRAFACGSCT